LISAGVLIVCQQSRPSKLVPSGQIWTSVALWVAVLLQVSPESVPPEGQA